MVDTYTKAFMLVCIIGSVYIDNFTIVAGACSREPSSSSFRVTNTGYDQLLRSEWHAPTKFRKLLHDEGTMGKFEIPMAVRGRRGYLMGEAIVPIM